jgi:uncharacterized protein (DUF433 family)
MTIQHPHVELRDATWYVVGTKVPVHRMWSWHRRGTTVETLLKRYPQISPGKVLDALSFAYDNQDEMDAALEREQKMLDDASVGQRKLPF